MAGYADDRTEPPTPRRRQDARRRGQVARSQDLSAAALLLSGFIALVVLGPGLWRTLLAMTQSALSGASGTRRGDLVPFAAATVLEAIKVVAPILVILLVAGLIAMIAQVGFLMSSQAVTPSLTRISVLGGIKRLLSIQSLMLSVTNFGKLLVVAIVAYFFLFGRAAAVIHAFMFKTPEALGLGGEMVSRLGIILSAALLMLALLDYAWQRARHERDLRMTKEEVKDELRSMEGDPLLRRRRREVQLQLALHRLRKDVPTADVVVSNPTHVAVAVRYDSETMIAPKVVAKGADSLALRIRQIAAEFGVPVVQRPPLARALYESVKVGDYVPERLYRAIAEVLAYVYELAGSTSHPYRGGRAGPRRAAIRRSG